jgi:hypothetical protein
VSYQPPQPQPQPIVVNVVQNAYPPRLCYVPRRRVNHWFHFWMTLFTSGLWAPVWIHAARKCR